MPSQVYLLEQHKTDFPKMMREEIKSERMEATAWSAYALAVAAFVIWASWKGGQIASGFWIAAAFAAVFWLARHSPLDVAGLTLFLGGLHLGGFSKYELFIPNAAGFVAHRRELLVYLGGITPEGLRLFAVTMALGFSLLLRRRLFKYNPLWPFSVFLAIAFLSLTYTELRADGMRLFIRLCYCFFIFLTIYFEARTKEAKERLARYIILGGVLSLSMALTFYVLGEGFDTRAGLTRFRGRGTGFLPHYEYFAGIVGLFFASKFLIEGKRIFAGIYALCAYLVYVSITRIAIGGALVGATALGIALRNRRFAALHTVAAIVWIVLMFNGIQLKRAPFAPEPVFPPAYLFPEVERPPEKPKTSAQPEPKVTPEVGRPEKPKIPTQPREPKTKPREDMRFRLSKRDVLIEMLISKIKEQPLRGIGLGSTQKYVPLVLPGAHHPHMDYLRMFAETGIFGFGFFFATLVAAAAKLYKMLRHPSGDERLYPAVALAGLAFFSIIMLAENGLNYYNGVAQYAWAYLGLAFASDAHTDREQPQLLSRLGAMRLGLSSPRLADGAGAHQRL